MAGPRQNPTKIGGIPYPDTWGLFLRSIWICGFFFKAGLRILVVVACSGFVFSPLPPFPSVILVNKPCHFISNLT